jgi:hypothetical protein
MFNVPLISFISGAILIGGIDVDSIKNDSDTKVVISGKWLLAFQKALEKFGEVKKSSLSCYKVTAYVKTDRLIVYFYAAPEVYNRNVRGQPNSCGKSITYFLNQSGDVMDIEYLR